MGNQLISFRLNPEIVSAIAQRYPGLSPSEGAKALILETLGLSASPEIGRPDYLDILNRLEMLEKKVFAPDATDDTLQTPNNDDPVSTPNDTLMTPDDTLQTPNNDDPVSTLLTLDDTKVIIAGLLAKNQVSSLRGIVDLLKTKNIKIPGKAGTVQPTISNIKPFLPDWWVKG